MGRETAEDPIARERDRRAKHDGDREGDAEDVDPVRLPRPHDEVDDERRRRWKEEPERLQQKRADDHHEDAARSTAEELAVRLETASEKDKLAASRPNGAERKSGL